MRLTSTRMRRTATSSLEAPCQHEYYHDRMAQLTLRVDDELVHQLKAAAASQGRSVNSWASAVLAAAVDPDLAGAEADVLRARLSRAGLLMASTATTRRPRPARAETARARAAAGEGRSLAELVGEDRV